MPIQPIGLQLRYAKRASQSDSAKSPATPRQAGIDTLTHLAEGGATLTLERTWRLPFQPPAELVQPEQALRVIEKGRDKMWVQLPNTPPVVLADLEDVATLGAVYDATATAHAHDEQTGRRQGKPEARSVRIAMEDWGWLTHDAPQTTPPLDAARSFAAYVAATRGDSKQARAAFSATAALTDGGPLGLSTAERRAWYADGLRASGDADTASAFLAALESAPSADLARERRDALSVLLDVAHATAAKQPLAEAAAMLEAIEKATPDASGAPTLADVARAVALPVPLSESPFSHGLRFDDMMRDLVAGSTDRVKLLDDLRSFGAWAPGTGVIGWAMFNWPGVQARPEGVPRDERLRVMSRIIQHSEHWLTPPSVYRVVAAHAHAPGELERNLDDFERIVSRRSSKEAQEIFDAIMTRLQGAASDPQTQSVRREMLVTLSNYGVPMATLEQVDQDDGRTTAADRERLLMGLIDATHETGQGSNVMGGALSALFATLDTLGPQEDLIRNGRLVSDLVKVVGSGAKAATIMRNLDGARKAMTYEPMEALLERFNAAYEMTRDVETACDAVRSTMVPTQGNIEIGNETVTIGGVAVPRRTE